VNADWYSAYWRDQKFPAGINGKTHVQSTRSERPDLRAAVRHLHRIPNPTATQVIAIVRLHRVEAYALRT
jgi:hypothetical protein